MASDLQRNRRRVGYGMVLGLGLVGAWFFAPGLPVLWGPSASEAAKQAGRDLFERAWVVNDPAAGGDGLGPVFNATSCVACHFQGGAGGGGPNQHNVLAFEVLPSRSHPRLQGGLIHHFAVAPTYQETSDLARKLFPVERGVPERIVEGCVVSVVVPDFDPLRTESINSTALFGAGWVDRISDRNIKHNQMRKGWARLVRELDLDFHGVPPGRVRVLPDGRVGKFGWRGQFATLQEFVAAACANELGLGNPLMPQPKPLGRPDYPAAKPDLDGEQFGVLVAFVDTLAKPVELLPQGAKERTEAIHGKDLFTKVGCAICHVPSLGGVDGIYSDLLLYDMGDPGPIGGSGFGYGLNRPPPVPLPEGHPKPTEWKTPPLWGVADSAPYLHDGGSATLQDAILRHAGDAASVTKNYKALPVPDQRAVVAFLQTLKAPPQNR